MKTSYMNNIIVKALMNGIISMITIALCTAVMHKDVTLNQALFSLPTICTGIACGVASYIGFLIRDN